MIGTLVIRADASAAIGMGHVLRMLALAQAWRARGGDVVLASAVLASVAATRAGRGSVGLASVDAPIGSVDDAHLTAALARERNAGWIAVDGYGFDADYHAAVATQGARILTVDDYGHAARVACDLLLSPGPDASRARFAGSPARRALVGPRYALQRDEVLDARRRSSEAATVRHAERWLVVSGGSDPGNLIEPLLRAIAARADRRIRVRAVVGGGHPRRAEILEWVARRTGEWPPIAVVVDAPDMGSEMEAADLAISAAGGTSVELACMGVPALLVIAAENQRGFARALDAAGCAVLVGDAEGLDLEALVSRAGELAGDPERRTAMAARGRALVDGLGSRRVVTRMAAAAIALRPAEMADARTLWEWANDPAARAASFTSAPIPWNEHCRWLAGRIDNPAQSTWIALDRHGHVCGVVRLDPRSDGVYEISINVAPARRGEGLGGAIVRRATDEAGARGISRVLARIKADNPASIAAFAAADYEPSGALDAGAGGNGAPGVDARGVELWGILP